MDEGIRSWLSRPQPWQTGAGPDQDIVLATGAVLGRNLWSFPFPDKASDVERRTVLGEVFRNLEGVGRLAGQPRIQFEDVRPLVRQCLLEKGLIRVQTANSHLGCGLVGDEELRLALVVNEEDHLRLKAWRCGFAPVGAVDEVLELEESLAGKFTFAFSEEFGYLTARPTRVGTGLRLTALVHLPGLVMAGEIEKIVNALRQLQFTVRGLGERSETVKGCLFLISNLITLGRTEQEVAEDFAAHVGKIVLHERSARRQLYRSDPLGLEDLCCRSLAVCRQARLMSLQEGYDRLSNLRLGAALGILPDVSLAQLNAALLRQQPGHLELESGKQLQGKELMHARASMFRALLGVAAA